MKKINLLTARFCAGLAIIIIVSATSCNKFLDARPSKNQGLTIATTTDLQEILNDYTTNFQVTDLISVYSSDDNGLSTALYDALPSGFSSPVIQYSLWDTQFLPQTQDGLSSGSSLWINQYNTINKANLVLYYADKVSGTAEDIANIAAEAHFIRAYAYWKLANTFCLPYSDGTKNEPGLPLKTTPDYTIVSRSTLADTYALITADLNEALKTTVTLTQNGINRNWRANTAAVNGFAARFYLNQNDYTNALKYANASLALYNILVNYNTDMHYGNTSTITINAGKPTAQTLTINFPYTHDGDLVNVTYALGWKEFLYFRVLNNTYQWFIPSQGLLNLYDKNNDLRYKYHYVQNYSYTKGLINPALSYPGYVFFGSYGIPEGPTVAEMLLIKAECLARTADVAGAMTTVNQLYSKRTLAGTAALTASSQAQAIQVVLQERRREMPFSQRWIDIRRFNNNDDPNDDVALLSRSFYPYDASNVKNTQPVQTYTLAKGSRRFANPIPQGDINKSNGLVQQNTY